MVAPAASARCGDRLVVRGGPLDRAAAGPAQSIPTGPPFRNTSPNIHCGWRSAVTRSLNTKAGRVAYEDTAPGKPVVLMTARCKTTTTFDAIEPEFAKREGTQSDREDGQERRRQKNRKRKPNRDWTMCG